MTPESILDRMLERYPVLTGIRGMILSAYNTLEKCFSSGGRLYICGNGGSAADALHIVGELMKSFVMKRPVSESFAQRLRMLYPDSAESMLSHLEGALPAVALVENSALNYAFCNDVNPDMVFAQQIYGYAQSGDVLIGISTSGNAVNVLNAIKTAKAIGTVTIGLTGGTGGALVQLSDLAIVVPETETYKVQELHLPVYHALCMMLEQRFFGTAAKRTF